MGYKERLHLVDNKIIPVLLMSLLLLYGCVASEHIQYRDQHPDTPCTNASNSCGNQDFIQGDNGYLLGIIEFDDQGSFWSREKSLELLEHIDHRTTIKKGPKKGLKKGILFVIYTHGWKHNASPGDDNFMAFRLSLSKLQEEENALAKEVGRDSLTVVGFYLAWRGNSFPIVGLNNLTFWNRKNTAHEIGTGGIIEALVEIEHLYLNRKKKIEQQYKNDKKKIKQDKTKSEKEIEQLIEELDKKFENQTKTVLVTIGHSFGAAVLYSALSHTLIGRFYSEEKLYKALGESNGHKPMPYGDLMILVNPAFEAQRFDHLYRMSNKHIDKGPGNRDLLHNDREHLFKEQLPILAIFTAENDWANSYAFPFGRRLINRLDKFRDSPNKGDDGYNQWEKNLVAVGLYDDFISHYLCTPMKNTNCYEVEWSDDVCLEKKLTEEGIPTEKEMAEQKVTDRIKQRNLTLRDYQNNWEKGCWSGRYGPAVLSQLGKEEHSPHNPYIVVKVDKNLIDGHGGIWKDKFRDFLGEFILTILSNKPGNS